MKNCFIIGAGGFGREVVDTLADMKHDYSAIEFVDDAYVVGETVNGVNVWGGVEDLDRLPESSHLVVAVADSNFRRDIFQKYQNKFNFVNIIHPTAIVSGFASLGRGVIVQAFCVLAAGASVGDMVVMNAHSGAGHDANIGSYASIMSFCDVAGCAILGEASFMGTGCKIGPSVVVAAGSYLCAGSIVLRDVKAPGKLMGNPARIIG